VFQALIESATSRNTQLFLPYGIAAIGIDAWIERFIKIFQNVV
jgi:hypothetical protein